MASTICGGFFMLRDLWYTNCIGSIKATMKKMLIASVAVGAAIAGLIVYSERRNHRKRTNQIGNAAKDAYKTMNAGIGAVERNALHSMG